MNTLYTNTRLDVKKHDLDTTLNTSEKLERNNEICHYKSTV